MPMKAPELNIALDMETSDPDDVFALCFLTSHPSVRLRAVTVTPGTRAQTGLVRCVLRRTGHAHVPVGARDPDLETRAISPFLEVLFDQPPEAAPDGLSHDILASALRLHPDLTLVTGAPLQTLGLLLEHHPSVGLKRWVAQGGFAGDPVVPPEHRLQKFAGRSTCPTFNFNGAPQAALTALGSNRIQQRDLVSKNVCHGVVYDREMHDRVRQVRAASAGLALIVEGMDLYLQRRPNGKKFHDPLAAAVAVNREICTFAEVDVYRRKGEWGARPACNTNTWISIAVDTTLFVETLVAT